jgi:hypothetical protein
VGEDVALSKAEEAEEVGVGAEAAVPGGDAELRGEPSRDQRMVHAGDHERRDGEGGFLGWSEQADPRDAGQARPQVLGDPRFMRDDGRPPHPGQLLNGRMKGHRPHHIWRARLLALRRCAPHHLLEVDWVDRGVVYAASLPPKVP